MRASILQEATGSLCEVPGLHGPLCVSEKLIQRIWARGDYCSRNLTLANADSLEVLHPGIWNPQEGPDFINARLRIAGQEVTGDIEVHFHSYHWQACGQDRHPAFDRVRLHVVLFPPLPTDPPIETCTGQRPPTLVLLPRLHTDIETYAENEVLQTGAEGTTEALASHLLALPAQERLRHLLERSRLRWEQKCAHARKRLARLPWEEALHQATLEVLGYRGNRIPMTAIAMAYPAREWQEKPMDTEALFRSQIAAWKLTGCRPANHPRIRLTQYALLMRQNPQWLKQAWDWACHLPTTGSLSMPTGTWRRATRWSQRRRQLATEILPALPGSSRLDTLLCDALLPLASLRSGKDLHVPWHHAHAGDFPGSVLTLLDRIAPPDRLQPLCHGLAQAALQLCFEAFSPGPQES